MQKVNIKLIHSQAKLPTRMTAGSAGYDLYSVEDLEIPPSQCDHGGFVQIGRALIPTGLILELKPGTVGRVGARSGLSVKSNIETGAGWIDSDYRGELKVEIKNLSSRPYHVRRGDRIAQLVILSLADVQVEAVDQVDDTSRNSGGFGSTGA
jgi:deoxyuridine 5'-triphosphate nucleotidohydrolase